VNLLRKSNIFLNNCLRIFYIYLFGLKTYLTLKNLITQNNINYFWLKMFLITQW